MARCSSAAVTAESTPPDRPHTTWSLPTRARICAIDSSMNEAGVHVVAKGVVGPNAHSVAVDPDTHHIYLPLKDVDGQPVLRELVVETPDGG